MRNLRPGPDSGLGVAGGGRWGWLGGLLNYSRKAVSREVSGWISAGMGKNLERQAEECTFWPLIWETQGLNCLVWWQFLPLGRELPQSLAGLCIPSNVHILGAQEMFALLAPKVCHSVSDSYPRKHGLRLKASQAIPHTWAKPEPWGPCDWSQLPQILAHSFSENHLWWSGSCLTKDPESSLPLEIGFFSHFLHKLCLRR